MYNITNLKYNKTKEYSMLFSDINPHIRHARLHREAFNISQKTSKCYDCRLFYFDNISGHITANGEKYNIINKTFIFLPPETEYLISINFSENSVFAVLNFDLTNKHCRIKNSLGTPDISTFDHTLIPEYTLPKNLSAPVIRTLPQTERMMFNCIDNFILKNSYYREQSSALLKLILIELVKPDSGTAHSELCKNVLKYIQENYFDVSLTNEQIARSFSYHPYHLSNIIKEETGKSLHQFLIYYRIRNARDLLVTTKLDIAEIAWRSGFDSPAYFTKMFKQNVGITPREYRRQNFNNAF